MLCIPAMELHRLLAPMFCDASACLRRAGGFWTCEDMGYIACMHAVSHACIWCIFDVPSRSAIVRSYGCRCALSTLGLENLRPLQQ